MVDDRLVYLESEGVTGLECLRLMSEGSVKRAEISTIYLHPATPQIHDTHYSCSTLACRGFLHP